MARILTAPFLSQGLVSEGRGEDLAVLEARWNGWVGSRLPRHDGTVVGAVVFIKRIRLNR